MRLTRATPRTFQAALELGCQSEACAPPNKKGTGGTGGSIKGQTTKGAQLGPFYHGTRTSFKKGDMLLPGNRVGKENWPGMNVNTTVWMTRTLKDAWEYAKQAKGDGEPVVYVVEPVGEPENYAELNGWEDDGNGGPPLDEWIVDEAKILTTVKKSDGKARAIKIITQHSPKIVKTKSIPNVDDARLLDSIKQTHEAIHTPEGIHAWSQTRRSMIEMGRRGLRIRDELTKRGIKTGIKCRFCGNQPGLTHNH